LLEKGYTCRSGDDDVADASFYCTLYSVTNTNIAQRNYDTCGVYTCPGSTIVISGCGDSPGTCIGDQYLR
jgi:hypothetical protein